MYKKTEPDSIKEGCTIINKLFKKNNFFEQLCQYSNNDINKTIENLSIITNYYLTTCDRNINYDFKTLFERTSQVTSFRHDYLISPTNSYFHNIIRMNGFNGSLSLAKYLYFDIERLDACLSFYPAIIPDYYINIYESVEESIQKSFISPTPLYESILKQPKNMEHPVTVGEDEKKYYSSILEKRLKNTEDSLYKTCSIIGKKIFNDFIGKDALLVIIPKKFGKTEISKEDIQKKETILRIPSYVLSYIQIPSRYKLLSICNKNKKLKEGEKVSFIDGTPYYSEKKEEKTNDAYYYSRIEPISVTEEFIYCNSEFTQDINYDIDLIYGSYDYNERRKEISKDFSKNIKEIRKKSDLMVRIINGKYEIRNGRHRLLYLKHFYVNNYEPYKEIGKLDQLKEIVTIPMNVERTFSNDNINIYLTKIHKLNKNARFFKNNINDDLPELFIEFQDKLYYIKNEQELISLYNSLLKKETNNSLFVCNTTLKERDYSKKIYIYLILTLREKIYTMTLQEIISYLLKEGFYIDNTYYQDNIIDIVSLYSWYLDIQGTLQMNKYFNYKKDLIANAEKYEKQEFLGNIIISILEAQPELIELEWDTLYEILILNENLKQYDKEFLKEAADNKGYQKLKFQALYNDKPCTKKVKI